jgi:hypothetical protein
MSFRSAPTPYAAASVSKPSISDDASRDMDECCRVQVTAEHVVDEGKRAVSQ